jgi:putative glycosyltransferase (TIGR04372 family)
VNYTALSEFYRRDYEPWLIILKYHWHREKQRFLSLHEIFEIGITNPSRSSEFEKAGVELICNTPQEISDLAIELDERLKGQWQSQPGDEELQQRFWDIIRKHAPSDRQISRHVLIGASFLRNNTYLLD